METASTTVAPSRTLSAEGVAYAGLAFASFGWASAFIIGKVVLTELTPLALAAWRYVVAALVLLPFALRQRPTTAAGRSIGPLILMAVFGGILYPWVFLLALSRTSATNTALLVALNPVFTVLLAPIIGEHLTAYRLAGVVVALTGAATVITKGNPGHLTTLSLNSGDLLAVSAAACWALFNLASRGAVARLSPAVTNCTIYGVGAAALYALGVSEEPWLQLTRATAGAVAGIVAMAILSSVLAGQFFLVGVRRLGVSRTVVFVYLVPVLTAALSALLLGERFELAQAVGGGAVLAGVYLSTRAG